MQGRTMTEGSPWKHILIFALPVLAGSVLQQLYSTVDSIIVGNFSGEAALSAVGTTSSFTFFFLAIAMGFSSGNGIVSAQHYGAGDEKNVRLTASTGILMLLGLGVFAGVFGIAVARPVYTHLLAVPESILELTLRYFVWYMAGIVFQYGYNAIAAILRSVGDSTATLYFLLIASVTNVALDYLFVAVLGWGVLGAAIATDIAQAGSFIAAYIYMSRKYPIFRFKLREFTWSTAMAKSTVEAGFPISLQLIIVSFGLTFIQRAVNGFGPTMTASFTVGNRIELFLNLPCSAFQTTLATYTGQNIGAGKINRVKQGVKQTLLLSFAFTIIISLCIWGLTDRIIRLFGLTAQAAAYCSDHLRTTAVINVLWSVYIPLFGVFQGSNHSLSTTIIAILALGVRVGVTYLFRYSSFIGYAIVWSNGIFGYTVGLIATWSYFLSKRWMNNAAITEAGGGMNLIQD